MSFKQESQNLITRKIKYSFDSIEDKNTILSIQKQYNNVLRFTYNRLLEGVSKTSDLIKLHHNLNNVRYNNHLFNSAMYEAKQIYSRNKDKKVIFGGKKLFISRCQNIISKEEFQLKKLLPISSIGESTQRGNRFFQIIDSSIVLFKPNKETHIKLKFNKQSKQLISELQTIKYLMETKQISVSVKLDLEYIYITFDYNKIKQAKINYPKIQNRVFAIDQNPNYLGYSVVDWIDEVNYKIIDKGVYSLKELNDAVNNLQTDSSDSKKKYYNNKRTYEVIKIAHELVKLAKHYRCSVFAIEDLHIKTEDLGKGRKLNKLVNNQWCRNVLVQQIKKLTNYYKIELIKVIPNYTSFIGNLVYRQEHLPDMILSSIEISRRGFEFYCQYLLNIKLQEKNIVFPNLEKVKERINQSLEELNYSGTFNSLKELYYAMKKSKQKYRFLLEDIDHSRVFSKFYKKRKVKLYNFI